MDNKISVYDKDGNDYVVEVLDIFQVDGYDKDYILYTQNREIDKDNIEVLVSILSEKDGVFSLLNIDDEDEWETVKKAIDEMGD